MKKLTTCIILALALTLCMSMSALAANTETVTDLSGANNPTEFDATATYVPNTTTVYYVDIAWGSMAFTYTEGTWEPGNLDYAEGTWSTAADADKQITVTNKSNAAVTATLSYASKTEYSGVTGDFGTNATINLATAVGATNAPSGTATLTLSGDPGEFSSSVTVGTVTVTIS